MIREYVNGDQSKSTYSRPTSSCEPPSEVPKSSAPVESVCLGFNPVENAASLICRVAS